VGQVVGIGIFLTPAEMASGLGASGWVLTTWLVVGFMALTGALCYGELASRFPEPGGAYVYLHRAWGERAAFLYGWMCLLVIDPGVSAALAAGLAEYLGYLTPLSPLAHKALAVAAILVLAALTILGTRLAAGALVVLTVLKLGILGTLVLLGLGAGDAGAALVPSFSRYPGAPALLPALAGGFVAAFFSFGGWWEAARMAGEIRDPQRNLPRAFVSAIVLVTTLYMAISAVFSSLVPPGEGVPAGAFAAQVGERLFGPAGGVFVAATVSLCVFGSLAAMMLSAPRTYVALARDGLFPARLSRLHPRFGTPSGAIAVQTLLAATLVALGTFSEIVAYFVFAAVLFVAVSVAGLYRLPPPPADAFRTPWRRVTPAIFVTLCVLLLALLLLGRPLQALLGLAVVCLGIPLYPLIRLADRPSGEAS
jgi:APA family basic amino acid/polyamine antiporter